MCGDSPAGSQVGGRIKRQPSTGRRMAAARKAGAQNRRASVSIRSEEPIQERKGPNVESIFNVMKAYMSLELELADENQVMQLASVLRENTSVTSINLSYNVSITDAALNALSEALEYNTTLTSLNLSGCTGFSDSAAAQMLAVLDKVFSLQTLTLSGCVHVGDQFAAQLAESMDVEAASTLDKGGLQLNEANLSGCKALSDEGVVEIGRSLANSVALKTLNLQGCQLLTDRAVVTLAEGLRFSPALEVLNLSWCEQLTDQSATALGDALVENRFLTTLMLSCCIEITDAGGKALASGLEANQSLTTLDLSWITKLGEPTLHALTRAMIKNRFVTTLNLTGTKCVAHMQTMQRSSDQDADEAEAAAAADDRFADEASTRRGRVSRESISGGSPRRRQSVENLGGRHMPTIPQLLQRNRSKPAEKKTLASSVLGDFVAKETGPANYGKRGLISSEAELLRTLRATILNGAALYNAEDAEGCLKLFTQTAESIVASTRSLGVIKALDKVNSIYAPREMSQKLWLLRSAFDDLVDDLVDKGFDQ